MKNLDELMPIIARYLAGIADSGEIAELQEWTGKSEENKRCFEQIQNIWNISDRFIDSSNINTQKALEMVLKRISRKSNMRNIWYYWQKVAAFILFPLIMFNIIFFILHRSTDTNKVDPVYNEVYTTYGTRSTLKLADGTLVWLNSGSSFKYPTRFDGKERQVYLQGEGYFEVASDAGRPFIVHTPSLLVKATGTKFNILEYKSNQVSEVTLVSGKVIVNKNDENKSFTLLSELEPNQHLDYNRKTGAKNISYVDSYKYIAWKDGKLIFRNEPLGEVINKISSVFNVDIELQGKELIDYRYRATFQDESLTEILKLLKISSPIDYIEVKRGPLPDGSFPRKKVIIFPVKTNNK